MVTFQTFIFSSPPQSRDLLFPKGNTLSYLTKKTEGEKYKLPQFPQTTVAVTLSPPLETSFKIQPRVICLSSIFTLAPKPSSVYIHHITAVFMKRSPGSSFLIVFYFSWLMINLSAFGSSVICLLVSLFAHQIISVLKGSVLGFLILQTRQGLLSMSCFSSHVPSKVAKPETQGQCSTPAFTSSLTSSPTS